MYKILFGRYDRLIAVTPRVNRQYGSITIEGMILGYRKLVTYDLRKYCFTNRALNIWNSLPNHVVLSDTVNTFKSRLDKFWQHQ